MEQKEIDTGRRHFRSTSRMIGLEMGRTVAGGADRAVSLAPPEESRPFCGPGTGPGREMSPYARVGCTKTDASLRPRPNRARRGRFLQRVLRKDGSGPRPGRERGFERASWCRRPRRSRIESGGRRRGVDHTSASGPTGSCGTRRSTPSATGFRTEMNGGSYTQTWGLECLVFHDGTASEFAVLR